MAETEDDPNDGSTSSANSRSNHHCSPETSSLASSHTCPQSSPGQADDKKNGKNDSKQEEGFSDKLALDSGTRRDDSGIGRSSESSYPIPATDYFTGPSTVSEEEGASLVQLTAAATRSKRLTTLHGRPGLDPLSMVTVRNQRGCLSYTPDEKKIPASSESQEDVHSAGKPNVDVYPKKSSPSSEEPEYQHALPPRVSTYALAELEPASYEDSRSPNALSLEESFWPFGSEDNGSVNVKRQEHEMAEEVEPVQREDINDSSETTIAADFGLVRQFTEAEIHKSQAMSGTSVDPLYPRYVTFASRLATFPVNAHLNGVRINGRQFAENGFFYQEKQGVQSVTCFHCDGSLRQWVDGMDPKTEHIALSYRCRVGMP